MRILHILLVLLLITDSASAGRITGRVSDEKTGEPVIGATVLLLGTPIGTATDIDGNFQLGTNPGTYTLQVKYLGYQSKEVEGISIKGDETITLNILIAEASNTLLNEVVIRSSLKKENISALYVLQKNSASVSSGISADLIRRSPDRNTGEVLKRVSGASIQNNKFVIIRGLNERYNAGMINGAQMQSTEPDKKAFSYDVIPSNLIDNIIVNKTASPDLPGDFAGGVVQVLTKDVPEENFLNAGFSLGYNTQATLKDFVSNERSGTNALGFFDRKSGLPNDLKGDYKAYNALSQQQKQEAARALGNKYPESKTTALPNANIQIGLGNVLRFSQGRKLGTVVGLVFRNSYNVLPGFERGTYTLDGNINSYSTENSYRYGAATAALANFSYAGTRSKISFRNLFSSLYDNTYYQREGYSISSVQQFRLNSSVPNNRTIYSAQLDGDHRLGNRNAKLNWNLNYAHLASRQPDIRTMYYSRNGVLSAENQTVEVGAGSQYTLTARNTRRFFSDLRDNALGGNVNLALPFQLLGQKQTFKAGYSLGYKNRDFTSRTLQYEEAIHFDTSLRSLPQDLVLSNQHISENGYELRDISNPDDAYKANSILHAAYLMLDNHIGAGLRISWGARFESYTQTLQAFSRSGSKINETETFNDLLPSINVSYSPNEKTRIRLSSSRTVNRPEFRELAPFQFIDYENNWTLQGNPELKRANITNVDFRYERYPAPGEAITAGIFYKHFKNPIEHVMNDQSNYDLLIFGYRNAPSAQVLGAELDVRKTLSFLSDAAWLDRFVIGANATYIYSRVDVSSFGISQDRPLQGQSPYLLNFSALYNEPKTGLAFSALFNRVGERIHIVGKDDIPTIWEKARNVVDVQISKEILNRRAELKLTVADLLNQSYTYYWNFDDANTFSSKNDRIFQKYRMGTSFTVGFNYRFGK